MSAALWVTIVDLALAWAAPAIWQTGIYVLGAALLAGLILSVVAVSRSAAPPVTRRVPSARQLAREPPKSATPPIDNTEWSGEVNREGETHYDLQVRFHQDGVAAFRIRSYDWSGAARHWTGWSPGWRWEQRGSDIKFGTRAGGLNEMYYGSLKRQLGGQIISGTSVSQGAKRTFWLQKIGEIEPPKATPTGSHKS